MSCTGKEIYMQIDNQLANERKKAFITTKKEILSKLLVTKEQPNQINSYDVAAFLELLNKIFKENAQANGLRLYVGSFVINGIPDNDSLVPVDGEGLLTIILVPTIAKIINGISVNVDIEEYYAMKADGTSGLSISKSIAYMWVSNYRENALVVLSKTVSGNNGDTRSFWFWKDDIIDFVAEISCQISNGAPIKTVNTCWGAYAKDESVTFRMPNGKTETLLVDRQLTFVFTIPGAKSMSQISTKASQDSITDEEEANFDMANPCPPDTNCNDDGSSL